MRATHRWLLTSTALCLWGTGALAEPSGGSSTYFSIRTTSVALRHVAVIDGTGEPPRADQTVVISEGRIAAVGPAVTTTIPAGTEIHDYSGYSVLPGLVGMHDHLFYTASREPQRSSPAGLEPGFLVNEVPFSAPRLYLAAGVTTLRTTGSLEPYTDLKVRSRIEAGA
ncbi:MAG: amidohydrolase, partial [Gammaproteobacteria bacterium]|nr:amidohydrolase [Gammaproteobacteria bacterium]